MDGPKLQSLPTPPARELARSGHGIVHLHHLRDRTHISRALARQPLKLLTPTSPSHAALVYATTLGGGLLAGDQIHLDLHAHANTTAFLTTQSATKVFRSPEGRAARQTLDARFEDDSLLVAWPDPLVCFASARYEQRQTFHLARSASLAVVDCHAAGRVARHERWAFARYFTRNRVLVDGQLLLNDTLVLDEADAPLASPFRTGRFNALASVILIGPKLESLIDDISRADATLSHRASRVRAPFLSAVSRHNGALILRFLAEDPQQLTRHLRNTLGPLTQLLGQDPWSRKW
jgi:urease accessory protein